MAEEDKEREDGGAAGERPAAESRARRLAEALRANLRRRKEQARARRAGERQPAGSATGARGPVDG